MRRSRSLDAAQSANGLLATVAKAPHQGCARVLTSGMCAIAALRTSAVIFSVVAAFRFAGGRSDSEILAAHAIYWYAMSVIYTAIWFVVYVTK